MEREHATFNVLQETEAGPIVEHDIGTIQESPPESIPSEEQGFEASQENPTEEVVNTTIPANPEPDVLADINFDINMDGTSHTGISLDNNENYSANILRDWKDAHKPLLLQQYLKEKKFAEFLEEGRSQIQKLSDCIFGLNTHNDKFLVLIMCDEGDVLTMVEKHLGKKSAFTKWRRGNFLHRHVRNFQQAQQLANMGDFARMYASFGRDRLLSVDALKKFLGISIAKLLKLHPFPDTAGDFDGELFRHHVDAILTLYRLKDAGIKVGFEYAALFAACKHRAINVKEALLLREYRDSRKKPKEAMENYFLDKCTHPHKEKADGQHESIDALLGNFLKECKEEKLTDTTWISYQQNYSSREVLLEAYNLMQNIVGKLYPDTLSEGVTA